MHWDPEKTYRQMLTVEMLIIALISLVGGILEECFGKLVS